MYDRSLYQMDEAPAPKRKWLRRGIKLAILLLFVFIGKKGYDYAMPFSGERECLFVYPLDSQSGQATPSSSYPEQTVTFSQKGGFLNDASCLNRTAIYGVVEAKSAADVKNALAIARSGGIPVTALGQEHVMGGQSFARGALVVDLRGLRRIDVDERTRVLRAQAGALWSDVLAQAEAKGLSPRAVPLGSDASVGGSIAINAHGIAHDPGHVGGTVRSVSVMLPSGDVRRASPTENAQLFRQVIGGYGLFGIILEAELDLTENATYARWSGDIGYMQFPTYYAENIQNNAGYGLFEAGISLAPGATYLRQVRMRGLVYPQTVEAVTSDLSLAFPWLHRFMFNIGKRGAAGRWVSAVIDRAAGRFLRPCRGGGTECLVSRNQALAEDMTPLRMRLNDTDLLQEYFIPPEEFVAFIDGLHDVIAKNDINVIDVTVRGVRRDTVSTLPYAKRDMFAVAVTTSQPLTVPASKATEQATRALADLALTHQGTFSLAYRPYYSKEQMRKAYPTFDGFVAAKKKADPKELLMSKWYQTYR